MSKRNAGEDTASRTQFAMVPTWVYAQVTNAVALRLYVILSGKYANGKRQAYPTIERLAGDLGVSERYIKTALRTLELAGAVVTTRTTSPTGRRNHYWLPMDEHKVNQSAPSMVNQSSPASDQHEQDVSAGKEDHIMVNQSSPTHGEPEFPITIPTQPQPDMNQISDADASDSDARASCPGRDHPTTDDAEAELGREAGDLFASWPGLDPEQNESQDPRTPPLANVSSTNGDSRGSGVKVKRTRRSSSRAPLPPDQAEALSGTIGDWAGTWQQTHGVKPTDQRRKQAAREIRALLVAGNDFTRVNQAARMAARAGYATVEQQLVRMTSTNGGSRPGRISATELPRDDWRRFVQE